MRRIPEVRVTRSRAPFPSNARRYKWGKVAILPGEDRNEFDALHADLIKEWAPEGAAEHDAVLCIANAIWRKQRVQNFIRANIEGCTFDPEHLFFDRERSLRNFYFAIKKDYKSFDEALKCLSESDADHFRNEFQRGYFKSTAAWKTAIKKEVSVLISKLARFGQPPLAVMMDRSARTMWDRPLTFLAKDSAKTVLPNDFERDLDSLERLEAVIDKAIKRLIQLKTDKQMLSQSRHRMRTKRWVR
jgi:hypothetical protein